MIHKVDIIFCRDHLMWIVGLQCQLLEAICDVNILSPQVTETWVIGLLAQLDRDWVTKICRSYKPRQKIRVTLLQHMQAIADFPEQIKIDLFNAFKHDLQVLEDLDHGIRPGRTMRNITSIGNKKQQESIRGFFEIFYEPNLNKGKGYLITITGNEPVKFDRSHFVRHYKRENKVKVCPLCDGQLGQTQVDHFYPKSHYPFLSCHPLNLVPICKDCNMFPYKGTKLPIDHKLLTDQMEGWFHPVFEPLADWRNKNQHPPSTQFRVEFVRINGSTTTMLKSDDARITKRLENLDTLIDLQARWQDECINQYQGVIDIIQDYHVEWERSMTEDELVQRLEDLSRDAKARIGTRPHAILEFFYTQQAAQRDPKLFQELWIENIDGDPLTGM